MKINGLNLSCNENLGGHFMGDPRILFSQEAGGWLLGAISRNEMVSAVA